MFHDSLCADLKLIDLPQSMPGYEDFLACWLYVHKDRIVLVDPGPTYSAKVLIDELRAVGVNRVDLVLLTHIHLDHAGGTAVVLDEFPSARWYSHPGGVRFLTTESDKLWQGSLNVLGDVARAYGRPAPIPRSRLADEELLAECGIKAILTPGHAAHHVSFLAGDILFAGEAIATRAEIDDVRTYLRPATPPRFFPDVFFESLDSLAALEPEPAFCAFAHYGAVRGVKYWCELARKQLEMWLDVVHEAVTDDDENMDDILRTLISRDELFSNLSFLEELIQERERYYAKNSLKGLMQSLREEKK